MTFSMTDMFVFTAAAGFGGFFAGRIFGCKMSLPVSFAIAAIGAATYLLPTVGAYVSFLAMVVGTWRLSDGELMESLLTAGVARLMVIPALIGVDTIVA